MGFVKINIIYFILAAALAAPCARAEEGPVAEPAARFREASDYIKKMGSNPKISFCEYTDATKKKVEEEAVNAEHASHKASEKLVKRMATKINFTAAALEIAQKSEHPVEETVMGPVEHLLDGFMIPAADTHAALVKTTGFGDKDRSRFDQLVGPGMQGMVSAPIDTSTGASNFDCKGDFDKLTSQLDDRATKHQRLAGMYKDLGTDLGYRIRDYRRGVEGKTFLSTGKCEGVSDAISGIAKALEQQKEAVEKLQKYNQERADSLSKYSSEFRVRQQKCQLALQAPWPAAAGPYKRK